MDEPLLCKSIQFIRNYFSREMDMELDFMYIKMYFFGCFEIVPFFWPEFYFNDNINK